MFIFFFLLSDQGIAKDGDSTAQNSLVDVFGTGQVQAVLCFLHDVRSCYKHVINLEATARKKTKDLPKLTAESRYTKGQQELANVWKTKCKACKSSKHKRVNADFVKKLQKACTSAFCAAPTKFISGRYPELNTAWVSAKHCRSWIQAKIEQSLQHLFGECGASCEHKPGYVPKTGSVCTCPVEQAQIKWILKEKIFDRLPRLVLDECGPLTTNRSESVG